MGLLGVSVAVLSATQARLATDARAVDVQAVSDLSAVSAAAGSAPVVRVLATTCVGAEAGSGFVLGDGIVITAAHVVHGASVAMIDRDGGAAVPATVVGVDGGGRDIAVLYAPALAGTHRLRTSGKDLAAGTEVAAAGHPRGGARQVLAGVVAGYVDSGPVAADGGRVLTVSMTFVPGMSGGPVVDADGRVVGVVIGVERNSGTGIAVPIGQIEATLHGDDLAPAPSCDGN
jgi:S1-C subfamily serine protease